MMAPNGNRNFHQNRPNPTNGKRHHGKSIDVSMVLPTWASNQHQQRSINSYLLAPYDGELNTIPEMLALDSTALSVAAQSETKSDNEPVTGAPQSYAVDTKQRATTAKSHKQSNYMRKNATVKCK